MQHCIARRIDAIVLQVDWRRYSEHLIVQEEDKVNSMFQDLLRQQPQCHFRVTVYSMAEKTQFLGFMCPQVVCLCHCRFLRPSIVQFGLEELLTCDVVIPTLSGHCTNELARSISCAYVRH